MVCFWFIYIFRSTSFNFVLQLKLVIYSTFYFGPHSFIFLIKLHCNCLLKNPFICFNPKIFICFNFVFWLKLIIYFIFHFILYSLNFLFGINFFGFFFVFLVQCLFFTRIYTSWFLFLFSIFIILFFCWGFIFFGLVLKF